MIFIITHGKEKGFGFAVHVILFMGRQEEIHGRLREYDGGQFPVRHEADLGRDENMDMSMFKT